MKIIMIDRPYANSVDPDQTMNVSTEMYFWSRLRSNNEWVYRNVFFGVKINMIYYIGLG